MINKRSSIFLSMIFICDLAAPATKNTKSNSFVQLEPCTAAKFHAAFSKDHGLLATTSEKGVVKVWDLTAKSGVCSVFTLQGPVGGIDVLEFSPEGKYLAIGSCAEHYTKIWDVRGGQCVLTVSKPLAVCRSIAFSPNEKHVALGYHYTDNAVGIGQHAIEIWSLESKTLVLLLGNGLRDVNSLAFSQDGHFLAATLQNNNLKIWDLIQQVETSRYRFNESAPDQLTFSQDGASLFAGFSRDCVRAFRRTPGGEDVCNCIKLGVANDRINSFTVSPIGQYVAFATENSTAINICNVDTGKIFKLIAHEHSADLLAFSPDSMFLASASSQDHNIKIWDLSTKKCVYVCSHKMPFHSLAFASDGPYLIVVAPDGEINAPVGGVTRA